MSTGLILRIFFVLFICGSVTYVSYFRRDREAHPEEGERPRYTNPFSAYFTIPAVLLVIFAAYGLRAGWQKAAGELLDWSFGLFTHISLYYALLLAVLPVLRRHFSARSCGELWVLPTMLYMVEYSFAALPKPLLVLDVPGKWVRLAGLVWVLGAAAVFLYRVLGHLVFRRWLLHGAKPVTEEEILAVFQAERESAGLKKNYKLVRTPRAKTPLSIGLFRATTRVVLPEREYTPEELRLIFRHELVHISREDAGTKFFLLFCTAVCWFHPLMWIAMGKSAEDLELSCDETVLLGADAETRRAYGTLILNTAGDSRGFTTCLSASARALRYRLKSILTARRVRNGGLLVGGMLFLFMMTYGCVALRYDVGTGETLLFEGTPEAYTLRTLRWDDGEAAEHYDCTDEVALLNYLSSLECHRITGNFQPEEERELVAIFQGPEGARGIVLSDTQVQLVDIANASRENETWQLQSLPDWAYVTSLLQEKMAFYADPDDGLPEACITLDGQPVYTQGILVNRTVNGKVEESRDITEAPAAIGFLEPTEREIAVAFSQSAYNDFTVEVQPLSGGDRYTLGYADFTAADTFRLAEQDAQYTVYAVFRLSETETVSMAYRFEVTYE